MGKISAELTPADTIVVETTTSQTRPKGQERMVPTKVAPAPDNLIAQSTGRLDLPRLGSPDDSRQTREGSREHEPATRTTSTRQELRYDPMTRKGRRAFRTNGATGVRKRVRFAVPITRAEAGDLLKRSRRTGGEKSSSDGSQEKQQWKEIKAPRAAHRSAKGGLSRYKYFTDEGSSPNDSADEQEIEHLDLHGFRVVWSPELEEDSKKDDSTPDLDDYRAEEAEGIPDTTPEFKPDSGSDDKENLPPGCDDGLGTGASSSDFAIYDESAAGTPHPNQPLRSRLPLGELPVSNPRESIDGSDEDGASANLHPIARQAENLRRAAVGEPPIVRSSLWREIMPTRDVFTDDQLAPPAASLLRARTDPPDQLSLERRDPLSRRPPNEVSEIAPVRPESDSSPRLVLEPISDEEASSTNSRPRRNRIVRPTGSET
ncbi:MAG: hypothetical protein LQ345_002807 [Seirophora villosa]|nr:MAG: hypothetical protein LQ345_002807 [Seirophora villosa]